MLGFGALLAEGVAAPVDLVSSRHVLREVPWTVPDLAVERYRPQPADLHHRIERDGVLVCHWRRYLLEVRR